MRLTYTTKSGDRAENQRHSQRAKKNGNLEARADWKGVITVTVTSRMRMARGVERGKSREWGNSIRAVSSQAAGARDNKEPTHAPHAHRV